MTEKRVMPETKSIRVMIADDQALVRAGFRRILENEPDIDVVAEAGDGFEAIDVATRIQPDVAIVDVRMPRLDGIEATQRIASASEDAPRVLILTTYRDDEYVYAALRAGASAFVVKDAPPEKLVEAVRVVAAGESLLDPSVTRSVIEEFVRRSPSDRQSGIQLDELTERELEVLKLIARGQSNAEIAETLGVSGATVKTHVAHVLMKLRVRDRAQAAIYAYESGLIRLGGRPVE